MIETRQGSVARFFLWLVGIITFAGPLLFWLYIASMACAFSTNNVSGCGPSFVDVLNPELWQIVTVPWLVSAACFWVLYRGRAKPQS